MYTVPRRSQVSELHHGNEEAAPSQDHLSSVDPHNIYRSSVSHFDVPSASSSTTTTDSYGIAANDLAFPNESQESILDDSLRPSTAPTFVKMTIDESDEIPRIRRPNTSSDKNKVSSVANDSPPGTTTKATISYNLDVQAAKLDVNF